MKIKLYLMLLLSVALLQSCAGKIKTVARPSLMQKMDYNGAVISEKKHTVALNHYTKFKHIKHKIIFALLVQNRGREPFRIGNENISMEFREKEEVSVPKTLEIQPLDDFLKDLENDYSNAQYGIISNLLGDVERTGNRIESLYDYDPHSAAVTAEMFAPRLLSVADDLDETIRAYEQLEGIVPYLVFKPQTITPGRSITGLIIYDTGDIDEKVEGEFNAVISIEGEEHRFVFSRSS